MNSKHSSVPQIQKCEVGSKSLVHNGPRPFQPHRLDAHMVQSCLYQLFVIRVLLFGHIPIVRVCFCADKNQFKTFTQALDALRTL